LHKIQFKLVTERRNGQRHCRGQFFGRFHGQNFADGEVCVFAAFLQRFAAILATILPVSMSLYLMMEVPSFGGMGDVTRMKDEAQNFRLVEAEIRWVVFNGNSRDKRSSLFCRHLLVTEKTLLI